MDTVEEFKLKKYTIERGVISKEMRSFISQYAIFDELQDPAINDGQVISAHAKYADPAMETLLLMLQPTIERITGIDLYPTYSYHRVYRNGSMLKRHLDRPSCEISATVCFGYNYSGDPWPIYINDTSVALKPGDIAVYRGCELTHWRNELTCSPDGWQVQGFFHYVDQNGPFTNHRYDNRESIGFSKKSNNKSYIRYIK